jgi:hypothetical protein
LKFQSLTEHADPSVTAFILNTIIFTTFYQRIIALAQVNPLPKATNTKSPFLILPISQASVSAIGMDAAVVLPNFWILLKTCSSLSPNFFG